VRANLVANRRKYSRYLIVVGVILLIGVFIFFKRDWFVAAVVNRQPITTVELYQSLKAKYGEEILTQIIRDKLIIQEASRRGVRVNQEELDNRIKEVEEQVGGKEQLSQALAQNNLTEENFRTQIRIQLLVEKMLEDKISVSEEEIDKFIADNPDDPNVAGTDDDKGPNREAISEQLRADKLNQEFQTWYQELEKKSSIIKFI
jgi:parvulin-like peptidyl-prolyl isomerase